MTESIGQRLRQARQARDMSVAQVAQATYMRERYLHALEADQFEKLPSAVQARGFLRAYAEFLGLPAAVLLAELDRGPESEPVAVITPEAGPSDKADHDTLEADTSAGRILAEIGEGLRQQRELLGLSLDDVERHTHLRQHYLSALERGRLEDMPSPVQGRGMLNNYAAFLGLDPEPVLLRFADALQARLAVRQAAEGRRTRPRPILPEPAIQPPNRWRRLFSLEILLVVFVVVFLAGFMTWGAVRIFAMRGEQPPAPTAPSIAEVLLAPATPTASATPVPPTSTIPAQPPVIGQPPEVQGATPQPGGEGVRVYVTVRQRTWVRVLVDGDVEYEGRLLPGSAFQYIGEEQVELLAGNGAGLQVFFNQQDLGSMGSFGEVAYWVFNTNGVQTPTPTVTWTPTVTSRPTNTPPATAIP